MVERLSGISNKNFKKRLIERVMKKNGNHSERRKGSEKMRKGGVGREIHYRDVWGGWNLGWNLRWNLLILLSSLGGVRRVKRLRWETRE